MAARFFPDEPYTADVLGARVLVRDVRLPDAVEPGIVRSVPAVEDGVLMVDVLVFAGENLGGHPAPRVALLADASAAHAWPSMRS